MEACTLKIERTTSWTVVLAASLALATLTGCGMTKKEDTQDGPPDHGTRRQVEVDEKIAKVSSDILDVLTLKGKASEPGPGVLRCGEKDRDKHFRIWHPWSLTLKADDRPKIDEEVKRLNKELPERGWEIKSFGRDSSRNKNLTLVADHDKKKVSIQIISQPKDDPPMLMVRVISGCYEVPEGETVDHY